ncbi:hypothetical protein M758_8G159600 [Ceratodon purpureus]|nr:hypothetical protein M758_8G159600 [Ceratodon purpureus]
MAAMARDEQEVVQRGEAGKQTIAAASGFLDWTTWQMIDSILPTGGFAHSYGLEAAVQAGLVYDGQTLERFAVMTVENAGALLLPFVYAASRVREMGVEAWVVLDCGLHAVMANGVARAASVGQGKALVRLAGGVFKEIAAEVAAIRGCVMGKPARAHGHHAVVVGRLLGLLGVDAVTAQRVYLYLTLRDVLSAATRLNLVGPMEAALLQHRHAQLAERVMGKYANRSVLDAHQIAPVIDTLQGSHTQLFSRLFCS